MIGPFPKADVLALLLLLHLRYCILSILVRKVTNSGFVSFHNSSVPYLCVFCFFFAGGGGGGGGGEEIKYSPNVFRDCYKAFVFEDRV